MTKHEHNFSHLNNRPAVRLEDTPANMPFRHLLSRAGAGSNDPSQVEGWAHRTRSGGFVAGAGNRNAERAR